MPGNDPARFDFAVAQRADPVNSGQYAIRGDSIFVRLGTTQEPETLALRSPKGGVLWIARIEYTRQ